MTRTVAGVEEAAGRFGAVVCDAPLDRIPMYWHEKGPATGKHRIMRVENPTFAQAMAIGAGDQMLPGERASYFLEAGFGARHILLGHLSTAVLTGRESEGLVDMRVIEGGRDAAMPALCHELPCSTSSMALSR